MYSNKINAFFFFIILCFVPLLISADVSKLSVDHYKDSCPHLQGIVFGIVWNAISVKSRNAASLLRLHFHDCFVNGCDASLLLDGKKGEQFAGPNKNSILALDVIDNIKAEVEKQCQNTVSCADILTLAARDAVQIAIGEDGHYTPSKVVFGRLDGLVSNQTGANLDIPGPNDSVDTLTKKFAAKGLNVQDMVALSGAHTIGLARCSSFKNRLYSSNTMNRKLLATLQKTCPNDTKSDSNTAPLDWQTSTIFDNKYYENIRNNAAVLQSDQVLASDSGTIRWVNKFKDHEEDFFKDFWTAMDKMGKIGVITQGSKPEGEIRKRCGSKNKP